MKLAFWEAKPYICKQPERPAPGSGELVFYRCSACLKTAPGFRTDFCPSCGARMIDKMEEDHNADND